MKDLVRQKLSLHVDIMDLLNEQIKKEAHSSSVYLAMASWCDQNGLINSAKFFYEQSQEEREHMMRIFHFINDNGGTAYSPEVSNISHDYNSLEEIFENALDQEIAITKSIHNIVLKCRKVQDLTSEYFLQWFVKEQMEEEQTFRRALELFDLMGTEGMALKFIDERIPGIREDQP
ncbi:ferritin [Antarcticibacterium flavum]|uniref:Ferritin n=1 Tax=Antarcticibacterium flavum TaxID=2058175 RepID=A0A5B7X5D7_9FLAO|nr:MULTISPECIES: ferritin [Antarcticibacterium]MCM4159440.1 ferritin [Antarcticibacterium sp. W02-3]QCY69922.1 ferritin [Antarcticibacterium flavum]